MGEFQLISDFILNCFKRTCDRLNFPYGAPNWPIELDFEGRQGRASEHCASRAGTFLRCLHYHIVIETACTRQCLRLGGLRSCKKRLGWQIHLSCGICSVYVPDELSWCEKWWRAERRLYFLFLLCTYFTSGSCRSRRSTIL